jgi:hypothetical protein
MILSIKLQLEVVMKHTDSDYLEIVYLKDIL